MTNTALNRTVVAMLTNKSGGAHVQGDVCVIDSSNASAVVNTTTAAYINGQIAVCLDPGGVANNAIGAYVVGGYAPKVNLSSSASLGDLFKTHTVAKQAVRHAAPIVSGDFGIVLGTGTTPAALLFGQPAQGALGAILADGSVAFTADQSLGGFKLTNVADPSSAQHAATKAYVDSIAVNLGKRARVRAATTANITIATALNNGDTLDGVTLATGDLVLVKDQSAAEENGVYVVGVSPARFSEFDTYDEYPGSLIAVQEGTANADTAWLCTSNVGGTIGVTALAFSALSAGGAGSDTTAIHDNVANEISAITEKTTLHNDDLFIIEDSEASGVKKKVKKSNVGGGGSYTTLKTIWYPDAPPASAGSEDSEFSAGSGGVPSGFTEYDPGTKLTVDESSTYKKLICTVASGSFPTMSGIYRSIPAGDFTIWTKVHIIGQRADYAWAGLALFEDATDSTKDIENLALSNRSSSGPTGISQFQLLAYNSYNADRLGLNALPHFQNIYFRWRRNSTSYFPGWSFDGETFIENSVSAVTVGFTPTHFGLAMNNSTGVTLKFTFDFFRYVASDVGVNGIMNGAAVKLLV